MFGVDSGRGLRPISLMAGPKSCTGHRPGHFDGRPCRVMSRHVGSCRPTPANTTRQCRPSVLARVSRESALTARDGSSFRPTLSAHVSVITARCYASAVLAMGMCLCLSVCVRLSQVGVLLKRQNVGSHKQHHTIPQGL